MSFDDVLRTSLGTSRFRGVFAGVGKGFLEESRTEVLRATFSSSESDKGREGGWMICVWVEGAGRFLSIEVGSVVRDGDRGDDGGELNG
jgi:hypothetical protein